MVIGPSFYHSRHMLSPAVPNTRVEKNHEDSIVLVVFVNIILVSNTHCIILWGICTKNKSVKVLPLTE